MSTNGRTPKFLDSLKTVAVSSEMTSLNNQLKKQKTVEQGQQAESTDSNSPSLGAFPSFAVLPRVRESEFLPSISRWTTLAGLFAVTTVGIAIALATLTKYNVTVKAQATIRPTGELRLVQAATEGSVKYIWAQENQIVKKGNVLAILDDSHLQTQKSQMQNQIQQANLQLTQINAQIQALDTQIFAETERSKRSVASAKAELSHRKRDYQDRQITTLAEVREAQANLNSARNEWQRAKAELKADEANLRAVQSALEAASKRRDRYQRVAQAGALSQDQLDESQDTVNQQEQTVEVQKATIEAQKQTIELRQQAVQATVARLERAKAAVNPTGAEVAIASESVGREKATGEATNASLKREKEALIQQRIALQQQLERDNRQLQQVEIDLSKTKIAATADGIIAQLNLRNPGQTVNSGQEIAQIVPNDVSLIIEAAISPSDIGKLKTGQLIQMQVSACPYPDYGTLKGVVSKISQDTIKSAGVSSNNLLLTSNQQTAFYKVAIAPESLVFGQGKNQCMIKLGMQGKVDIISREETVLQFLLRKARLLADV
ncbi:MAG: HlyD family efflux transporter periplasmic adaptor subunit [Nostoc sp.]